MRKIWGKHPLGRDSEHRWAMLRYVNILMIRNQVTSLIKHERIKTTVPKAKELRKVADKMVTLAKEGISSLNK